MGIITESDIFGAFTEILGGGKDGMRLELIIGKTSGDLYLILKTLERYRVDILAITVHDNFSDTQRLVTLKIETSDRAVVLDHLRRTKIRINRIEGDM